MFLGFSWDTWRPTVTFGWKRMAGLVCVQWGGWAFHFIVRPSHRQWGCEHEWLDGSIYRFGLGPWFLFSSIGWWRLRGVK